MLRKHTPSLYKIDEVISALQKSIRRGLMSESLFWGSQLIRGGFGGYLLNRLLPTIACEDIGFGWIGAAPVLVTAHTEWNRLITKTKPKLPIRDAWQCEEANRIALTAIMKCVASEKSRLVATASGWAHSLQADLSLPKQSNQSVVEHTKTGEPTNTAGAAAAATGGDTINSSGGGDGKLLVLVKWDLLLTRFDEAIESFLSERNNKINHSSTANNKEKIDAAVVMINPNTQMTNNQNNHHNHNKNHNHSTTTMSVAATSLMGSQASVLFVSLNDTKFMSTSGASGGGAGGGGSAGLGVGSSAASGGSGGSGGGGGGDANGKTVQQPAVSTAELAILECGHLLYLSAQHARQSDRVWTQLWSHLKKASAAHAKIKTAGGGDRDRYRYDAIMKTVTALEHIFNSGGGSPRLCWMMAVLLFVYGDRAVCDLPSSHGGGAAAGGGAEEEKKQTTRDTELLTIALKLLKTETPAAPESRLYRIPDWALDKHTERGRNIDTRARLTTAARLFDVTKTAEAYDDAEIAKSHGVGISSNNEVKSKAPVSSKSKLQKSKTAVAGADCDTAGEATAVGIFFTTGATINNPWSVTDPYATACQYFYQSEERVWGSRKAKSKFMNARMWESVIRDRLISTSGGWGFVASDFTALEGAMAVAGSGKKKKQPIAAAAAAASSIMGDETESEVESESDEPLEKVVRVRSSKTISTPKRKRAADAASTMTDTCVVDSKVVVTVASNGTGSGSSGVVDSLTNLMVDSDSDSEDLPLLKKLKPTLPASAVVASKPKVKTAAAAATATATATTSSSSVIKSTNFEYSRLPVLSRSELRSIRNGGILGQLPCGKVKKMTYLTREYVWKGPYDVAKPGDRQKVVFSVTRAKQLLEWKVGTPDCIAYRVEPRPTAAATATATMMGGADRDGDTDMSVAASVSGGAQQWVWLRFPQLSPVPISDWKFEAHTAPRRCHHDEPESDTESTAAVTAEDASVVVDDSKGASVGGNKIVVRASMGVHLATHIPVPVWTETSAVLIPVLDALIARYCCDPPCGDTILNNMLVIEHDEKQQQRTGGGGGGSGGSGSVGSGRYQVFTVDLEENRSKSQSELKGADGGGDDSDTASGLDSQNVRSTDWYRYVFSSGKFPKKATLQAMCDGLVIHADAVRTMMARWTGTAGCGGRLSAAQQSRWEFKALWHALNRTIAASTKDEGKSKTSKSKSKPSPSPSPSPSSPPTTATTVGAANSLNMQTAVKSVVGGGGGGGGGSTEKPITAAASAEGSGVSGRETWTFTFSECVENNSGMETIGTKAADGLSLAQLQHAQSEATARGFVTELIDLEQYLPEKYRSAETKAWLLIIRNGASLFLDYEKKNTHSKMTDEDDNSKEETVPIASASGGGGSGSSGGSGGGSSNTGGGVRDRYDGFVREVVSNKEREDRKAFMRGRVVNKHARWNLCYTDRAQSPDYANKKGTIIAFDTVPYLARIRSSVNELFGHPTPLYAELNHYYDIGKCGIGYHGDGERRIVIGVRVGAGMNIIFHWFHRSLPVSATSGTGTARLILNDGDAYAMSAKAVGHDWKRSSIYTLRHSAGCEKFTKLPTAADKKKK